MIIYFYYRGSPCHTNAKEAVVLKHLSTETVQAVVVATRRKQGKFRLAAMRLFPHHLNRIQAAQSIRVVVILEVVISVAAARVGVGIDRDIG